MTTDTAVNVTKRVVEDRSKYIYREREMQHWGRANLMRYASSLE